MIVSYSTLTSIQKPHTDNIFSGKKFIEWRKRPLPYGKHFCYETKKNGGCGKIIGQFDVNHVARYNSVDDIDDFLLQFGCVSRDFLREYSSGKPLYANFIWLVKRYDVPLELVDFVSISPQSNSCFNDVYKPIKRPPQNYCFVLRR